MPGDTKIDFDQAVINTVKLSGQSPLGVFFLMNYVTGFPLTHSYAFTGRDPQDFQMVTDTRHSVEDGEQLFWGAFQATYGGRSQYCDICLNVLNWLGRHTTVFKNSKYQAELHAIGEGAEEDAKMFLKPENTYFKTQKALDKMGAFYQGEFFGGQAVRNDAQLRAQILHRLHDNTGKEMGLSVMCRVIAALDVAEMTKIPTFIDGFRKNRSSGNLNYKDVMNKLESGIGVDRATISANFFDGAVGKRMQFAEVINDKTRYDTLLTLHYILFYSNYNGQFNTVVDAIFRGDEHVQMAPYARVFPMKHWQYELENSNCQLSHNSAELFKHIIREVQHWGGISPQIIEKAIGERETNMFGGEGRMRGIIEGKKTKKTSGFS